MRYGKIKSIKMMGNFSAVIQFEDSMGALLALKHLNGYKI
jgi:hypothetical protein